MLNVEVPVKVLNHDLYKVLLYFSLEVPLQHPDAINKYSGGMDLERG